MTPHIHHTHTHSLIEQANEHAHTHKRPPPSLRSRWTEANKTINLRRPPIESGAFILIEIHLLRLGASTL